MMFEFSAIDSGCMNVPDTFAARTSAAITRRITRWSLTDEIVTHPGVAGETKINDLPLGMRHIRDSVPDVKLKCP
jgi:hypothetical protein